MIQPLEDLLLQAKQLIASGKLNDAAEILDPLKNEHPMSQDVARLWCSLAMRTHRASEVLDYAEKIYAHVQSDFYKAHWAQTLGTASFILLDLSATRTHFVTKKKIKTKKGKKRKHTKT